MRVAFLSPQYPPEQPHFTRGLAQVGAQVIGVGDQPLEAIPASVRRHLAHWIQVPRLFDEAAATKHLVAALGPLGVDRIETLWEPLVLLAAGVRDRLGVPGMSRDAVLGFRDKETMKQRLRPAGVRVPHSFRVRTEAEDGDAADEVGFPLILKPISGAGSANTYRCDDVRSFEAALKATRGGGEYSVEEFIDGEEFTWDAVCVEGEPVYEGVMQYFPRPLIMRSEQWISPAQLVFSNPYVPKLTPGLKMGRQVVAALGMGTGFVHMEWYRKADGEVVFGEIGCRNGGGHLVDLHNWANDIDLFTEWARAVCWHAYEATPKRKYNAGMVFKRAQGEGRIVGVTGLDAVRRACGPWLLTEQLLPIGSPRRDWKKTLISDGFVAMRHPDLGTVERMMDVAVTELRLYAR